MKMFLCLVFITFSMMSYSQQSNLKICDCDELTLQGKKKQSAYKDKIAYSGKCQTKNLYGIVIKELNYYNGQLEGKTILYYPSGNIKEMTEYSKNIKHGIYILNDENGKPLIEGNYKNMLKDGKWKYFDKKSKKLTKTAVYELGKEKTSIKHW